MVKIMTCKDTKYKDNQHFIMKNRFSISLYMTVISY